MKQLLLTATAAMLATAAMAQVSQPQMSAGAIRLDKPVKASVATRASSTLAWGYSHGISSANGLGQANSTIVQAAYLPEEWASYFAGVKIVGLRIASPVDGSKSSQGNWVNSIPSAVIFLSEDINKTAEFIVDAQGTLPATGFTSTDIKFDTPYTIEAGKPVYYGFVCTTKTAKDFPVVNDGVAVHDPNGTFVGVMNGSKTQWISTSGLGNLCIELLLEGDIKADAATIDASFLKRFYQNQDVPVSFTVHNNGTTPVKTLGGMITIGTTQTPVNVTLPEPLAFGEFGNYEITAAKAEGKGPMEMSFKIDKVNGVANTITNAEAKGNVIVFGEGEGYPRTILVEEFTTERCGNCPTAASRLATALETFDKQMHDRASALTIHAGYYTDWLTLPADNEYVQFFNAGGSTYAPAFMIDRSVEISGTPSTPVFSTPNTPADLKNMMLTAAAIPSTLSVDIDAEYVNETGNVKVKVHGKKDAAYFNLENPRVVVQLAENAVKARSQSGAVGVYYQQHVKRAINSTWGDEVKFDGDDYVYECEFPLDKTWNTKYLQVVAYVANYNADNVTDRAVENSKTIFFDKVTNGVDGILADGTEVRVIAENGEISVEGAASFEVYTLSGMRCQPTGLQSGVYVVRVADKAFKVAMK